MLAKLPVFDGLLRNVNITTSQSPLVSVPPPKRTAGEMKRAVNSMPMLFSWRWMISYVRARSGLPDVVVNANFSSPTPGQLKIFELPADGVSGPPVQPFFLSSAIAFRWLNFQRAYGVWYCGSNGLKMLLCRTGSSLTELTRPVLTYSTSRIWPRLMPVMIAWRTNAFFSAG